jgi:hypothetical protein
MKQLCASISLATLLLAGGCAALSAGDAPHAQPTVALLSSRPDTVSGGDALVSIQLPREADPADLKVFVGNVDVTAGFKMRNGSLVNLVSGLHSGANEIRAVLGDQAHTLTVVNHDRNGPIFSGPHQTPFICETHIFKLPDGSTLGPALDDACNAPTKVIFLYKPAASDRFKVLPAGELPSDMSTTTTLAGKTVNFIVRLETGTVNRAIYQIAVLFDPTKDEAPSPFSSYGGWNGKAVFSFGGGATAGYHQGSSVGGEILDRDMLSRGFAVLSSSLNVMAIVGNDVVSAETASMVKERFIEEFGPPTYLMGWGGSGGSMQQHLIANNYPGILDGITPGSSFPDLYTIAPYPNDCVLIDKAVSGATQPWSDEQKRAASGLNTWASCKLWISFFAPEWTQARQIDPPFKGIPDSNCHSILPRELTYDPQKNPRGARCDLYSAARNSLGFDPETGATFRAFDNVGVQYGLHAYQSGAISAEQFVELNETIGGLDHDGEFSASRSVADPLALQRMFAFGRVNQAKNLGNLPVIDLRGNPGSGPEVHDAIKSETTRARLLRATGNARGHVIVRGESGPTAPGSGAASANKQMNLFVLLQMDEWLTSMADDSRRYANMADKVAANRPGSLKTDVCFMADGRRIEEASDRANAGECGSKLNYWEDPRMAAGAPLTNDILKCQLRPFREADYPHMSAALKARLAVTFASGVCDYAKPSVGYAPLTDVWLAYPQPGVAVKMN